MNWSLLRISYSSELSTPEYLFVALLERVRGIRLACVGRYPINSRVSDLKRYHFILFGLALVVHRCLWCGQQAIEFHDKYKREERLKSATGTPWCQYV